MSVSWRRICGNPTVFTILLADGADVDVVLLRANDNRRWRDNVVVAGVNNLGAIGVDRTGLQWCIDFEAAGGGSRWRVEVEIPSLVRWTELGKTLKVPTWTSDKLVWQCAHLQCTTTYFKSYNICFFSTITFQCVILPIMNIIQTNIFLWNLNTSACG